MIEPLVEGLLSGLKAVGQYFLIDRREAREAARRPPSSPANGGGSGRPPLASAATGGTTGERAPTQQEMRQLWRERAEARPTPIVRQVQPRRAGPDVGRSL